MKIANENLITSPTNIPQEISLQNEILSSEGSPKQKLKIDPKLTKIFEKKKTIKQSRLRFLFLFWLNFQAGMYYIIYNLFPAMENQLANKFNLNLITYNSFISFSTFPNIIISLIGGYYAARFGCARSLIVTSIAVFISQVIGFFGVFVFQSIALIYISQIISGVTYVIENITTFSLAMDWFSGKELSIATATLAGGSTNLTQGLGMLLFPMLVNKPPNFLWGYIVVLSCLFMGIVSSVFVYLMDKQADQEEKRESANAASPAQAKEPQTTLRASMHVYENKLRLKDIFNFRFQVWFIIFSIACSQASWYVFGNNVIQALTSLYKQVTDEQAGIMIMISYFSGFFSPFVGAIFDNIGYRGLSGVMGQIIIGAAYSLMIFLPSSAYGYFLIGFVQVLLQVGVAVYQSGFWCCLEMVTPTKNLALAFGMQQSITSLLNSASTLAYGALANYYYQKRITDPTALYDSAYYPIVYCIAFTVVSGVIALAMNILDKIYNDGVCNRKIITKTHEHSYMFRKSIRI